MEQVLQWRTLANVTLMMNWKDDIKDHVHLLFFANKKVNCDIINKAGAIFCVIGTVSHINH